MKSRKDLERVAKPCGGDFHGEGQHFVDATRKGREKKGFFIYMLKGRRAHARCFFSWLSTVDEGHEKRQ